MSTLTQEQVIQAHAAARSALVEVGLNDEFAGIEQRGDHWALVWRSGRIAPVVRWRTREISASRVGRPPICFVCWRERTRYYRALRAEGRAVELPGGCEAFGRVLIEDCGRPR